MSIPNYYMTLEIELSASDEDIKQAFRRLAKRYHPDKNPGREKLAERRFKQITTAYEVLGDREAREKYDLELKASIASTRDQRRDNLRRKARNGIANLCRLMLFELLNQNPQIALDIYDELKSDDPCINLESYMSDGDARDCEFLIAEAYHQRGRLLEAAQLYERVLLKEKKRPYFNRFAQEIRIMLRELYIQLMGKAENSDEIRAIVERILKMDISSRDVAWMYKKAAEAYLEVGDVNSAKESLTQAFQTNPKLTGAKKISRKLGIKKGT